MNSNARFPTTYNLAGEDYIDQNQDSFRNFSGATDGYNFRVLEYEVFQVLYK